MQLTDKERSHSKLEEKLDAIEDEVDDLCSRDIALARYLRNHDYLTEIFVPQHTDSILSSPLQNSPSKDQVNKDIEKYQEITKNQSRKHQERMLLLAQEQQKYWNLMKKLNDADSIQSIENAAENIANELHIKVEHTTIKSKSLPIPGLIDDDNDLPQQMDIDDSLNH